MTFEQEFRALHAKGLKDREIARQLGCSHDTVKKRRLQFGLECNAVYRAWSDDEEIAGRRMLAEGCTYAEIGRALKRSGDSVRSRFEKRAASHRGLSQDEAGLSGADYRPRNMRSCALHLGDLISGYGGGTLSEARAKYVARCERGAK